MYSGYYNFGILNSGYCNFGILNSSYYNFLMLGKFTSETCMSNLRFHTYDVNFTSETGQQENNSLATIKQPKNPVTKFVDYIV